MLFITIFLIGVQLGATACAISCLPIITPILLANNALNAKESLKILFKYFLGKIFAYMSISMIAFFGVNLFKNVLMPIVPFNKIGASLIILVGIFLLITSIMQNKSCKSPCGTSFKYGYFGIGFLSSFSFCLPVMSLVTTSALSSSLLISALYGLCFGVGVTVIPFLFFYFFIFKITNEISVQLIKNKKLISVLSSLLLIIVGFLIYINVLHL